MYFNTLDFAVFLPIVFLIYWFIANRSLRLQNAFLVLASYVFYGWWDWRFLGLIIFSTVVDYSVGLLLSRQENQRKRKILLFTSLFLNLGLLGFFKYFNFFVDNFVAAFSLFGGDLAPRSLNIILPVGISFYTFQTMSYSIDVYRRNIEPTRDLVAFAAFVGFFPQLVAGPIERATTLLPQLFNRRVFKYNDAVDGLRQILWGLFKKIVIADNCATYVDYIFGHAGELSGSTLIAGVMFFQFQIYCDFSGYSDIAIGTARLFGLKLSRNFAYPFFARDIAEYWRRWHMTLTAWLRAYLYIPLGGSRVGTAKQIRNVFIIFLLSGLWHGANWTFVAWGLLNAIYFLPLMLLKKNRANLEIIAKDSLLPNRRDVMGMIYTFFLTTLSRIFFRAENIQHVAVYCIGIYSMSLFTMPVFPGRKGAILVVLTIFQVLIIEWIGRREVCAISIFERLKSKPVRFSLYYLLAIEILLLGNFNGLQYYYFQF